MREDCFCHDCDEQQRTETREARDEECDTARQLNDANDPRKPRGIASMGELIGDCRTATDLGHAGGVKQEPVVSENSIVLRAIP
jgi:hypothetical protein